MCEWENGVCVRACAVTVSPETQIQSQRSLTFISFIHSKKDKQSGLRQGRTLMVRKGLVLVGEAASPRSSLSYPFTSTSCLIGHAKSKFFTFICKASKVKCVCVFMRVIHLSGHWWTRLYSFSSAAGSTCAGRRCTAMLGRLERAGQKGTCICRNNTQLCKCLKTTLSEQLHAL